MRKSLWGYHIGDSDALINSLQNQNNLMTTKITTLTMELSSMKEEMRKSAADKASYTGIQDEALKEKIASLERENNLLKLQNDAKLAAMEQEKAQMLTQMSTQTQKQSGYEGASSAESLNYSPQILGTLCERVYHDMEKMRRETAYTMMSEIDNYTDTVAENNEKMQSAISEIKEQYDSIIENLSDSVNKVFELLHTVEQSGEQLKKKTLPIDTITDELKLNVKKSVQASIKATENIFRGSKISEATGNDRAFDYADESARVEPAVNETAFPQWQKGKLVPDFKKEPVSVEKSVIKRDSMIGIQTKINPKDIIDM